MKPNLTVGEAKVVAQAARQFGIKRAQLAAWVSQFPTPSYRQWVYVLAALLLERNAR